MAFSMEQDVTEIANEFIDTYMPAAPHTFSIIYIYAYRHCLASNDMTNAQIALALDILESDVRRAWLYWHKKNVVSYCEEPFAVKFLNLHKEIQKPLPSAKQEEKGRPLVLESRPEYSPTELSFYADKNNNVRELFESAQTHLGRLMSQNDLSILFGLYDWLHLPMEVIEILLAFCAKNNNRSMRYIEKVAMDWADRGISTPQLALSHIKLYSSGYAQILRAFGIHGRNTLAPEEAIIDKWLKEYGFTMELLQEACQRTVLKTGNPNFKYADSILRDWKEKGAKTLDDIKKLDESFTNAKKNALSAAKGATAVKTNAPPKNVKKNRFVNFNQRDWDFEALEKMERKYLQESLEKTEQTGQVDGNGAKS